MRDYGCESTTKGDVEAGRKIARLRQLVGLPGRRAVLYTSPEERLEGEQMKKILAVSLHSWAAWAAMSFLMAKAFAADPGSILTDATKSYAAGSRAAVATLGDLQISNSAAKFQKIKVSLKLRYVGVAKNFQTAPSPADVSVYQVLNSDEEFKTTNHCQGAPIRWVMVHPLQNGEIWIDLLSIEDYQNYALKVSGMCFGGYFYSK